MVVQASELLKQPSHLVTALETGQEPSGGTEMGLGRWAQGLLFPDVGRGLGCGLTICPSCFLCSTMWPCLPGPPHLLLLPEVTDLG